MRSGRPPTHGLESHPLYTTWDLIKRRTCHPEHHKYKDYGARGIRLHPQWFSVAAFVEWVEANLGPRPEGYTLDRIENDGHYEPGNLRWATAVQQQRNKRNSRLINVADESRTLSEWSELSGISGHTIHYRIKRGWAMLDVLGIPPNPISLATRKRQQ